MNRSAVVRAGHLRGALIGVSSAGVSAVAHGSAGGSMPSGPALVLLLSACAAVGAAASGVFFARGGCPLLLRVLALTAGQAAGHLVLSISSHGHSHCAYSLTPQMLAAHGAAIPLCGVLIGLAERLYVVCVSALSWLTVFFVDRSRPAVAAVRRQTTIVVPRSVLSRSVGTRAPPVLALA
ncbi:MAG: hypothetical protein K0U80_05300 [Actinomycetia bacterium]|nr:hypothetical protein [Actinomycetes bacterium]MCH9762049.1 hypothetical protein [Actinomycetes bacterium]